MSTRDRLEHLRTSKAETCTRCALHGKRGRLVFHSGNPDATIALVGEAPGEVEDRTGEPFVGPAGQLLDDLLGKVGLRRMDVYVLNTLKCRPPGNRDPEPEELVACSPFLHVQLAVVRPRVVVAVGGVAGRFLTGQGPSAAVGYMRRHDWLYQNDTTGLQVPLIVTYHPSYILRNRDDRRAAKDAALKVIADLGKAVRIARGVA